MIELIPKKHTIPALYTTEDDSDPMCQVKLFTPDANWTWYIIELDVAEGLCFGYVAGLEKELGYFSLREIKDLHGALNLPVERDRGFAPIPLSEVQALYHD